MSAYLLLLFAVLSRVVPHPGWMNFTAVGGSLLYFGARRPLREAFWAVALLAGVDYYLTIYTYGYPFHIAGYLTTWLWYAGIVLLGSKMLKTGMPKTGAAQGPQQTGSSTGRIAGAVVLSATSFFLLSNFTVWAGSMMYPRSVGGLAACFTAGLPFYRNDLISTSVVAALVFGTPQLISHWSHTPRKTAASF